MCSRVERLPQRCAPWLGPLNVLWIGGLSDPQCPTRGDIYVLAVSTCMITVAVMMMMMSAVSSPPELPFAHGGGLPRK